MDTIPSTIWQKVVTLFHQSKTTREIGELTGINKQTILELLTKKSYWSKYCSECTIKRCYDCPGLSKLGKPVSIQDQIDVIASMKNDPKRT